MSGLCTHRRQVTGRTEGTGPSGVPAPDTGSLNRGIPVHDSSGLDYDRDTTTHESVRNGPLSVPRVCGTPVCVGHGRDGTPCPERNPIKILIP